MPKSLVAVVVVLVAVVAYLIGTSISSPSATRTEPTSSAHPAQEHEPAKRDVAYDARNDALVRELRDSNRALRAAIAELTTELRMARTSPAAPIQDRPDQPTQEQWTARLRAREPDVVMETVCLLREKMLTRALQFDAAAESAVGRIVGLVGTDLQQAQRVQEQNRTMYQGNAERCRRANRELDGLRTLDDVARWRVTYGDLIK